MNGHAAAAQKWAAVVASTYEQARLAAEHLGLGRRSWRFVRDARDLHGVTIDHIVVVHPPLGEMTQVEADINVELQRIKLRDGGDWRTVRT